MRIILLGAPGTGKGTQGKFISEKYGIPTISTGDMLRKSIYLKNHVGHVIKNTINKGELVSDKIVCNLIQQRIQEKDCKSGFLLDGFPRNIKQAHYLFQNKITIDYVIDFMMPNEAIFERISGRRIHLESGRIYHIKFHPPKIANQDDITGEPLTLRSDDTKDTVEKRLEEYKKTTDLLKQYYLKQSYRGQLKFFTINAMKSLLSIQKTIEKYLQIK